MSFWDVIALFFWTYVFVAFLMAVFAIVMDLFRDSSLGGFAKALWLIFLIFVPVLAALVYLIARGHGMATRRAAAERTARAHTEEYIRQTAGTASATQDIAKAHSLLEAGAISQTEYEALKARALGDGQRAATAHA